MAHFDLHEQDQISKLKYFWRDWGKYIVAILIILLIGYIGNTVWVSRATSNANNASLIFRELNTALQAKNKAEVYNFTDKLANEYPKVEYTPMAALIAAKVAYDDKDLNKALNYLNWTINNSKDKGLVALAYLRTADIYIDQKKFEDAVQVLMKDHEPSFDPLFYSKRGDIYVAKGDLNKARDAYKEAIVKAGQDQNTISIIQMKLDVLGS